MWRDVFPQLRNIFLYRRENDQSNNFDDDNHYDSEIVGIISMCLPLGSAYNFISSKKEKISTDLSKWNTSQN